MSARSRSRVIARNSKSKRREADMAQSRLIQAASCRASATANVRAKENRTNSEATVADAGGRISGNNTATGIELANSQPCSRFSSEGRGTHAKGSKHNEQAAFLNVVLSMVKDKDLEYITFDDGNIVLKDPRRLAMEVLPLHFRHNKFASFQRQLHYFGFRKIVGKGKVEPQVFYNCTLKGKEPEAILKLQRRTKISEEPNKHTTTSVPKCSKYSDKFPEDIVSLLDAPTPEGGIVTTKKTSQGEGTKAKTSHGGQKRGIADFGGNDGQNDRRNSRRYPPSRHIEFGLHETSASGGGGSSSSGSSNNSSSSNNDGGAGTRCHGGGTAAVIDRECAGERGGGIPLLITALKPNRPEGDNSTENRHRRRQQRVLQPHRRGTAERQGVADDGQRSVLPSLLPALVGAGIVRGGEGGNVSQDRRTFCGWQRPLSGKNGGDRDPGDCVSLDGNYGENDKSAKDTASCFEAAAKSYTTSGAGCIDTNNSRNGGSNEDTVLLQPTTPDRRKCNDPTGGNGDSTSSSIAHLLTAIQHEIQDDRRGRQHLDRDTSPSASRGRHGCSHVAHDNGRIDFSGCHTLYAVEPSVVPGHPSHNSKGHWELHVAGVNQSDGSPTNVAFANMNASCSPSSHTVPPPQGHENSFRVFPPGLTNGYSPLRYPSRAAEFARKNFGDSLLVDTLGASMYSNEWSLGGSRGIGDGNGRSAADTAATGNCGGTGRERAGPRTRAPSFDVWAASSDAALFDKDARRATENCRSRGSGGEWSPDPLPPTPSPLSLYRPAYHTSPSTLGLW